MLHARGDLLRVGVVGPMTHDHVYPHEGGCSGCRDRRVCNACGADLRRDRGRCTNGRCERCHDEFCTPGGSTSPGHGFGVAVLRGR